ncbi:MAG: NAD-dependent epimerase/dehydratase family protein [Chloroflexi bacterium]|nr:NAD-dependent epimerase/dehydratase family protein [Chloroflexota bacterium]MCI0578202.1 NAD-dependent epimerase/dehydratase family protein [Chloroflexota bacterium]MCI0645305.1 NAD-dependent epimerase/dehydratase family protein [Chloroflexota bacterium]MCI0729541.1 NAD-dependent epimerase/dehydratase family protein [Chloroflexota bacterium]
MRVVIIGGMGHVGTYLVPRLVEAGYEVINISRGRRSPYQPHAAWKSVRQVVADRETEDKAGTFGQRVRDLRPDIVIDMICFTATSASQLVEALNGEVQHLLHCGTIWVHGPTVQAPLTEEQPRRPFGDYGIQKAAVEVYLLNKARRNGFPATILHPGHIVGPGWVPLNPAGHFNPQVFASLARGEEVALPNFGMETVHHVHADDVAQAFMQAIFHRSVAVCESFHTVSPAALTLRGYAEAMAAWFGQSANLRFLPWEEWRTTVSEVEAAATWDHIAHSPCCSIAKAERLLNYRPRYTSLQAVQEAVSWLIEHGVIDVSNQ